MSTFKYCLEQVLKAEGGYVNHPADKGGPTNFGITLATLSAWRKTPCSEDDIKALPRDEAAKIYEANYWRPLGLAHFDNTKFAAILFDQAVNRGVKSALESLQTVLNRSFGARLTVDGVFGPATLEALKSAEPWKLSVEYIKAAQEFYLNLVQRNPSQAVFLKGWIARTWKLFDILV